MLVFESLPSSDGIPVRKKVEAGVQAMASAVRPSDVVGRAYDDTIVVLLVETGEQGAHDTLQRLRVRVARLAGNWQVTTYNYPHHEAAISKLPLVTAA